MDISNFTHWHLFYSRKSPQALPSEPVPHFLQHCNQALVYASHKKSEECLRDGIVSRDRSPGNKKGKRDKRQNMKNYNKMRRKILQWRGNEGICHGLAYRQACILHVCCFIGSWIDTAYPSLSNPSIGGGEEGKGLYSWCSSKEAGVVSFTVESPWLALNWCFVSIR